MDEKKAGLIERLISTLGFPIVVCGVLFYQQWTLLTNLTKTINENSELLRQLAEKIGGG